MKKIQRILVGVEFSVDGPGERPGPDAELTAGSLQAVREAAWLCQHTGARLTLLHSTWDDEHGEPGPAPAGAVLDRARTAATEAGTEAELLLVEERPWLAMVRSALRGETDMVCIGRRSTDDHPGFGSVADKLVRNCPAPVWSVSPLSPAPPARILVATDLSPAADRATELAVAIAGMAAAEVRVLHACQVPISLQLSEGRVDRGVIDAKRRDLQSRAIQHIRGTLGPHEGVHVQIHVVCDSPIRAIEHDVEEHRADLVALGTVSRGGIPGFVIGNTAERLLRRIETSVLTVKPADFVCPVEA